MFFLARAVQTSFLVVLKFLKSICKGHKCQAVTVPGGPATTLIYGLKSDKRVSYRSLIICLFLQTLITSLTVKSQVHNVYRSHEN